MATVDPNLVNLLLVENPMPTAVAVSAIGPIEVVCVHTNRPVTNTQFDGWTAQHAALALVGPSR